MSISEIDLLDGIPPAVAAEIRRIWKVDVTGGGARFKASGDRRGVQGQKIISQLLQRAGIPKDSSRWLAVIEHGRALYHGKTVSLPGTRNLTSATSPVGAPTVRSPVTAGHERTVAWMATEEFRALIAVYSKTNPAVGCVYFRPTDAGAVMMGFHDGAPCYVGLRTHLEDEGHCISPYATVPDLATAQARWAAFERWLPSVKRQAPEEQGVMPWLRRVLANRLELPELGDGWVFLNHEWRLLNDEGVGRKTDVLAVHLPTGRLGIVELKDDHKKLPEARAQVDEYARYWDRDAGSLAPLFTDLLRAQGLAYGNPSAAVGRVETTAAALFVGVATRAAGVRVWKR